MRLGRIQLPKLISYCGPAVFGLLVLVGITSTQLPTDLRTPALLIPIPLGTILGLVYYFRVGHQVLEFDEKGFKLATGTNLVQTYAWSQFKEVSLRADPRGRICVRMYFEHEGKYVEIPSETGADPYEMRNSVLKMLKTSD